ncbi:UNVERIFIED_CONTAM: hypothetical protein Slati_1425800 [Sesamum latifolium]|uniref:RNase H type-1 domain-containing protein n=1 Tax=Sesamum latifolium TaxID=2727402 RepID=A0AAW2X603_9LAMI
MAALSRFISQGAERGLPFFKTLRKVQGFSWNKECQEAFDNLKEHLSMPSLLTKLRSGQKLYIYLSISEEAVSAVLVKAEGKEHQPKYCRELSKVSPYREAGTSIDSSGKKLSPYFQSHQVTVLMNQPLKHILTSPNTSGRIIKLVVELSERVTEFEPRPAIKAQVLTNFISKAMGNEDDMQRQVWEIFVDGSSTSSRSGVGIVIKSPEADNMEYAITFEFPASNNEAEHKAILLGSRLIHAARARKTHAFSNSQLVVSQVEGEYEARQEKMTKYLAKLQKEIDKFKEFR